MKGLTIFGVMIVVSILLCGFVPFVVLPSIDAAMALPVISVPGEVLIKDFPVLGEFTNTMVGTLLADIVVLLLILPATMGLKKVPGRLQGFIEFLFGAFSGLATSIAGPRNAKRILPLAVTIFFFLLVANWLELVPGVDSIGLVHCAHEGQAGYETEDWVIGKKLVVPDPLYKGIDEGAAATHAEYEACEAYHEGHGDEEGAAEDHAEDAATTEENSEDETNTATVAATTEEGDGGEGEGDADHAEGAAEDEEHAVDPNAPRKEIITPFIRAAATDLNLTFALAVIAVIVIQYFGVSELGWGYPAKFVNTPALEKGDVMSFAVGWLELISEISKIISFAFRLFGNIFAGQILLFVIPFLVATLLPVTIYGLEFAVHVIQAAVFAMLFMVFASIAMTSHDHDEEHEHH